jgi:bacteriocin-like protein
MSLELSNKLELVAGVGPDNGECQVAVFVLSDDELRQVSGGPSLIIYPN